MANCPQCGAALSADAPAGLCPRCLIQQGLGSQSGNPSGTAPTEAPSGSAFVPPTADELQSRLPNLQILELIGQGGMGAVYKARQPGLDRLVAVKVLPPQAAGDPHFAERFSREARALARLSHPNIVAVYDFGQSDGLYYLVMEYVDGANVRQLMLAGRMSPPEALALVPQVCDALQFAHDEGIVHRDIKPENILVDRKGRVKIADFGLARLMGTEPDRILTGTHQVMGTIRYMAPEQMEGSHSVDHRADIYSLGVVFYELLTGELPLGRFAPPSKKVQVDVRLDEVVLRALEKEPELRYQSAAELKHDTESVVSGVPAPGPSWSGMVIPPFAPSRAMQVGTALGIVSGAMLATFGLVQLVAAMFVDRILIGGPGLLGALLGSGIGCLGGGLGSLFGCLNTYRHFDNSVDWLRARRGTLLDVLVLGGGLAAAVAWPIVRPDGPWGTWHPKGGAVAGLYYYIGWYTAMLVFLQAAGFAVVRLAVAGVRRPRGVGVALLALGLLVAGGIALEAPGGHWDQRLAGALFCLAALACGLSYALPRTDRAAPPPRAMSDLHDEHQVEPTDESALFAGGWLVGILWREAWFRSVLKWTSLAVYLLCLTMFFTYQGSGSSSGDEESYQITVGQPTPWIEWKRTPGRFSTHTKLISWSVGVALVGVMALQVFRALERLATGKAHSMWWHYALWGVLLVSVVVAGTLDSSYAPKLPRPAESDSTCHPVVAPVTIAVSY